MTKSPEQKAIEKQMRAQEKADRAAQIRERASGIVAGAHQENGFRILDFESETMLAEILRQYDGNENNTMSFELDNISRSLRDNALVLYEALRMYGMLASVIPYGNSAIMTVTESAKNYFENKDKVTNGGNRMEKQVKIFISHSSDDVKYVRRIVEFLEDLNVPEDGIFCSSIPEYGIPGGEKIFDFLRGQFDTYDLHVIFVLSKNYYNSIASLNEMGAAWVGRNEYTVLLLPHFPYSEIKGVLDPREIATKIDDESTINIRLSELRDKILSEFALNKINENKWERVRNSFIADMLEINLEAKVSKIEFSQLSSDVEDMILKLSEDRDGRVMIRNSIIGTTISIGSYLFDSDAPRKVAHWEEIIRELVRLQYIELVSSQKGTKIYKISQKGYEYADSLKIGKR